MKSASEYNATLRQYLPQASVGWVSAYVASHQLHLHISRERRTKYGDYRRPQRGSTEHRISVNGNLNPYYFLFVLLHEVAHMETQLAHGSQVEPHGHEWQAQFATLLLKHITEFSADLQPSIALYASHLPLRRAALVQVEEGLKRHDPNYTPALHVDDLAVGTLFRLKAKPTLLLRTEVRNRTRWLCTDVATRRQYTVAGRAEVATVEQG